MTEHVPHYTADTNDNPALPSDSHYGAQRAYLGWWSGCREAVCP